VKQAAEAHAAGQADISRRLDGKAMEDFEAAIKLDPQRWKSYHHRGVCYALAGQFEKALSDFTKTIELRPEYESAWFNRGEIHYEMGRFAKAVADYDEAIRLQANDAGFFTSRGHAHFQLRQFDKALDDYSRAVELDPRNPQRITNRGDAFRSLGQWERAADDFRQAVNVDSRFGRAFQSAAWLMSTCPDEQYRQPDLALRAARKAVELDGDQDYIYLDTLAAAFANSGQFDKAQEVIRRAIQLAPAENAGPLKHRLDLYRSGKPFRQTVDTATERIANKSAPR
jgi:tetratricopeptide (TPR) repeat protein